MPNWMKPWHYFDWSTADTSNVSLPFSRLLSLLQTMARASAILVWYRQKEGMVICTVTQEEIRLDTGLYCCQTVCVVYIITCQGCRHQYVGKATLLQTFVTAAIGLKWQSRICCWVSTFFTAKKGNYTISCPGCQRQYVGKAVITLDLRHCSHWSEMVEQKLLLGIHLIHCKKRAKEASHFTYLRRRRA